MGDKAMTEIRNVDANGLRFAYLEAGEGPLVLLIHGFPDTARGWEGVLPRIAAKGYRAVAPWTRGYHPTEIPMGDADGMTLCRDLAGLIDALSDDGKAIVVAHDWGASAAYALAATQPEKIAKLFVLAIPHPAAIKPSLGKVWGVRHFFLFKMPGAARRFAMDDFAQLREIYARWSPTWDLPEGELDAVRETFSHRGSLEAAMGYYRALPLTVPSYFKKKISVDTVVFAGTDDPIVSVDDYQAASRMFTGAYVVETMPGGHFLHREHPDEFADKLLAHL